jgi:hypothetical protein
MIRIGSRPLGFGLDLLAPIILRATKPLKRLDAELWREYLNAR